MKNTVSLKRWNMNAITVNDYSVAKKLDITEIFKNYRSKLQGFIRKRVRTNEDADDILQEVFFQLAETDKMMKPIDHLSAWLFTVARNRITDLYRKKKTESMPEFVNDDESEFSIPELKELLFENGLNPETEYLRSLVWEALDEALLGLPPDQRDVFEMHEMQGIPFKEISEITGEQVNTLITRKRYAVLFLREKLKTIYDELLN